VFPGADKGALCDSMVAVFVPGGAADCEACTRTLLACPSALAGESALKRSRDGAARMVEEDVDGSAGLLAASAGPKIGMCFDNAPESASAPAREQPKLWWLL
jgi:hypothetical protein